MELKISSERILVFTSELTFEEAERKAAEKKTSAFGIFNKLTNFLQGSRSNDFTLLYKEHRYQPFLHVASQSHYIYDRTANYTLPLSGPEIKSVTLHEKDYSVHNRSIQLSLLEHCEQNEEQNIYIEGVSGNRSSHLSQYLKYSSKIVKKTPLESLVPKDAIIVPPQIRASAIVRELLVQTIKNIQADKIFKESVEITRVDLYYRPVYAFQYRWESKGKEAIIEIDGLTGEVQTGHRTFNEYFGKIFDPKILFDIGTDAAGMILPGGNIAMKLAKNYMDKDKKK